MAVDLVSQLGWEREEREYLLLGKRFSAIGSVRSFRFLGSYCHLNVLRI